MGSAKKGKASLLRNPSFYRLKRLNTADDGARTRGHEVKSLALYRLSYTGDETA